MATTAIRIIVSHRSIKRNLEEADVARLGFRYALDLPKEFYIFERLQHVRLTGFNSYWECGRYLLQPTSESGKPIDPFREWDITSKVLAEKSARFFSPFPFHPYLLFDGHWYQDDYELLYHRELRSYHLILRGKEFLFAKYPKKDDVIITLGQILLRNESLAYNIHSKFKLRWESGTELPNIKFAAQNEVLLKSYGVIMKRQESNYFPADLERGTPLKFPAKDVTMEQALLKINEVAKQYEKPFFFKVPPMNVDGPLIEGLSAVTLVTLYGEHIQWNNKTQQYELVE